MVVYLNLYRRLTNKNGSLFEVYVVGLLIKVDVYLKLYRRLTNINGRLFELISTAY